MFIICSNLSELQTLSYMRAVWYQIQKDKTVSYLKFGAYIYIKNTIWCVCVCVHVCVNIGITSNRYDRGHRKCV